jgi:putative heme-binding domain-containing protein
VIHALLLWMALLPTRCFGSAIRAAAFDGRSTINARSGPAVEGQSSNFLRVRRRPRQDVVSGQNGPPQSAAIRAGANLFRERCADCHGAEAKGDRGPDLTRLWTSDNAEQRVFQIIRSGVPGSIMPPSQAPDEEIRSVMAYLRSISTTTAGPASRGNVAAGERTFWASCGGCHHVGGRGGRLGPDLSRIASSLSREALTQSIRDPGASIAGGYESVTLVTRDGQRIRGVRKGEDAFSIQIMDSRERLQGYLKADLKEVSRDAQSLMPSFGSDRLSDQDLDDLLAFMTSLRANTAR